MAKDKSRANYEQMGQIAKRFGSESASVRSTTQRLRKHVSTMQEGAWVGKAASAFIAEMDSIVLPSLTRLGAALESAQRSTIALSGAFKTCEEETARVLNGNGVQPGGTPATTGGDASGGDAAGPTGIPAIDAVIKKISDSLELKIGKEGIGLKLFEGSVFGGKFFGEAGEWSVLGGEAGIGIKQLNGKWVVGAAAEVHVAQGKIEGAIVGDKDLGWTGGIEAKALTAEGFAGYKDGSIGAEVEASLGKVEASTGFNLFGYNISVTGGAKLGLGAGVTVGKNTRVKLGPFELGFSIGGAK